MEEARPRSRTAARLVALVVALGVALQLPSLGGGFYADDYVHQLVLRGELRGATIGPGALYDFGTREDWLELEGATGSLPWWTGADWEIRFFRPLASLSLRADHALFGGWAAGYHVTSLALYALLLVLAERLFRALGLGPRAALAGLAFYAATNGAALPVGWIANRNALLGTLFTVAAVLAVARPERARSAAGLGLGLALALAACLCKESGVLALVLVACVALVHAREGTLERRRAVLAAGLAVALAAAFLVALAASGHGTRSLFYATPWREPLRYLGHLVVLFTAGLFRLVAPASLDLQLVEPRLAVPAVALSAVLVAVLALYTWPRLRRTPRARLLAAWLALGLLPQGATLPSDRLLLDAALGSAGLLALFVTSVIGKGAAADASPRERFVGRSLLVSAGLLSALFALLQSAAVAQMARDVRRRDLATEVGPPELGTREVLVLQAANGLVPFTLASTWAIESQDTDLRFWILQMGRRGLEWTREDERSFVLTSLDAPFLTHVFERVYRTRSEPPAPGTRHALGLLEVEALETDGQGLRAIRVRLDRSLDDPRLRFVVDREGVLVHLAPPAVGETLRLAAAVPDDPLQP